MPITFDEISSANRRPATLAEVSSSGPAGVRTKRVAIIGHRLSTGTVAADALFQVFNEQTGDGAAGAGSQLGEMCRFFKRGNQNAEVWGIGLADDGSGVAATGSLPISGTATESQYYIVSIGGRRYSTYVASGTAASAVLTAVKALIDADTRRPATAGTIGSGAIPLTCRWKGTSGNSIHIQVIQGVAGLTSVPVAFASGATDPSVTAAITALGSQQWDRVVLGISDATTVALFETEMARRFTADVDKSGLAATGVYGALSAQTTWAGSRNSRHLYATAVGLAETPFWSWAAQTCAYEVARFQNDPGQSRHGIVLPDCVGPTVANQFNETDRNTLITAGLSTYDVDPTGVVRTEHLVTTYLTDGQSQSDDTWRDVRNLDKVADYREQWKRESLPLLDYKLVDDGTPVDPGYLIVTPSGGKALLDLFYERMCRTGNFENADYFAKYSRCERNANDRNRIDFFHPINFGNSVVTIASRLQFTL